MICPKCKTEMRPGKAIQQTWTPGAADFIGDKTICTWSAGGPGKLVNCMKCHECGFSVSYR
jgi:hypothetical protein